MWPSRRRARLRRQDEGRRRLHGRGGEARGPRGRHLQRPGRQPDPGLAEGGGADRVGGGPPRRLDPQHIGDVPAVEATDPAIKEAETRARLTDFAGRRGEADGLPPRRSGRRRRPAGDGRNRGSPGRPSSAGRWPALWRRSRSPRRPRPQASSDVAVLNFALVLEYLQSSFYTEAERSKALRGKSLTTQRRASARWSVPREGVQEPARAARRSSGRRSTSAERPRRSDRSSRPQWPSRTSRWRPTRAKRRAYAPSRCSRRRSRSIPSRHVTRPGCASSSACSRRSTRSTTQRPNRTSSTSSPGRISSWRVRVRRCAGARISPDERSRARRCGTGRGGSVRGGRSASLLLGRRGWSRRASASGACRRRRTRPCTCRRLDGSGNDAHAAVWTYLLGPGDGTRATAARRTPGRATGRAVRRRAARTPCS